jgi:hypothetical protein
MKKLSACFLVGVILIGYIIMPATLSADGGPMVGPFLFANLKEGQQVAVVRLVDTDSASIDLFVSILDQTGESHEVSFFVPLGIEPSGFQVNEEDSLAFARSETANLDSIIFQDYRQDREYIQYLFAGALLTNGVWLTPLWLPMLLSGCARLRLRLSLRSQPKAHRLMSSISMRQLTSTRLLTPRDLMLR